MGVALSCLMSCLRVSCLLPWRRAAFVDLLKRFVVDEACSILGYVQLSFLKMLAELPERREDGQDRKVE